MYKILSHCPVCSDKLKATKLKCNSCNTAIIFYRNIYKMQGKYKRS